MIAPELYGLLCVSLYALGNAWSLQGPSAESMLSPSDVSSGSKSNPQGQSLSALSASCASFASWSLKLRHS